MSSGYYPQPPYPGAPFAPPPPAEPPQKPHKPWPLRAINRWMTIGATAITLVAVLLAVLASRVVSGPPSTAGMTLAYQSKMTQNTTGQLRWDENSDCQFTSDGYVVASPDLARSAHCQLQGSSYQDFTLRVRVVYAEENAVIGFLGNDRLAIVGSGRFLFYRNDPEIGPATYLVPRTGVSEGSAALHPSSLGVSERANDITIQVKEMTYSFYANGQLLATYTSPLLENPGPIFLGASPGQQAVFSDIAIYIPG
ncbi:MAG TPA: hypothetical protein VH599_15230 [Ktedonobacterales bacterium]|jgi:hypothetical protein